MGGLCPGAGVLEEELPHAPLRRCFRMPQPCADEAVARLQVQVERRRRHLLAPLVEQARALPGLVRRLVVGEARVALDADQRAAHGLRFGTVVLAHGKQVRLQVGKQRLEGAAHVRLVVGLVRLEPRALVVAGQSAQKTDALVGELGRHGRQRSEEYTSELQSLMRTSYAVFCLKKKTK